MRGCSEVKGTKVECIPPFDGVEEGFGVVDTLERFFEVQICRLGDEVCKKCIIDKAGHRGGLLNVFIYSHIGLPCVVDDIAAHLRCELLENTASQLTSTIDK